MNRLRKAGGKWKLASGGHRVRSPLAGRIVGHGPPVLFIHGLGSTHRIWGDAYDRLADSHRMGFVDLAGFGDSAEIAGPYDVASHLSRLRAFREEHLPEGPLVVVGYSFGGLLSLAASGQWDDVVGSLAFAPPLFPTAQEARRHFTRLDPFHRWLASGHRSIGVAGKLICRRPAPKRLLSTLWPFQPAPVMQDVLELSTHGLVESFRALLTEQDQVSRWVQAREVPRRIVQGHRDRYCTDQQVRNAVAHLPIEVHSTRGTHYFPIHTPAVCVEHVEDFLSSVHRGEAGQLRSVA